MRALCLLCTVAVLHILVAVPAGVQAQSGPRATLLTRLFSDYDDSVRPGLNASSVVPQPIQIDVQYRLNLLYNINSKDELWSADLFVREQWTDPRLSFNVTNWNQAANGDLRLALTKATSGVSFYAWRPDTFFFNAIQCTTTEQQMTLIYTGRVTWTRHQLCVFHSQFELNNFPFDSQGFPIRRISFGYNYNEMTLQHSDEGCVAPDPRVNFENSLWSLSSWVCEDNAIVYHSGQPLYAQTTATLNVQRLYASYILKMILPMFLLVLLSSMTYFIDPGSPPARVGFSVTIVLSIVTFNLLVSQDLPKINYSTLLDWYVWVCFLFVIFAVGEFAMVNSILTAKVLPPQVGWLIDDFCQATVGILWILSNLLFWPVISTTAVGDFFITVALLGWVGFNVYRVWWNFKNEQKGFALVKRLYHSCRERGHAAKAQQAIASSEVHPDPPSSSLPPTAIEISELPADDADIAVNDVQVEHVDDAEIEETYAEDDVLDHPAMDDEDMAQPR